jgi:hypothetical protein
MFWDEKWWDLFEPAGPLWVNQAGMAEMKSSAKQAKKKSQTPIGQRVYCVGGFSFDRRTALELWSVCNVKKKNPGRPPLYCKRHKLKAKRKLGCRACVKLQKKAANRKKKRKQRAEKAHVNAELYQRICKKILYPVMHSMGEGARLVEDGASAHVATASCHAENGIKLVHYPASGRDKQKILHIS